MLTISLLKNIAIEFSKPETSEEEFQRTIEKLLDIERTLFGG